MTCDHSKLYVQDLIRGGQLVEPCLWCKCDALILISNSNAAEAVQAKQELAYFKTSAEILRDNHMAKIARLEAALIDIKSDLEYSGTDRSDFPLIIAKIDAATAANRSVKP